MPKFLNQCGDSFHRISDLIVGEVDAVVYFAVRHDNLALLKQVAKQVNLDRADSKGRTPMYWAVAFGRFEIVEFLAKLNVDLNRADDEGHSAAWFAARSGRLDILQFLSAEGADLDRAIRSDCYADTPIYAAVLQRHPEIVEFLIEKKVTLLKLLNDVNISREHNVSHSPERVEEEKRAIKNMIAKGLNNKRRVFNAIQRGDLAGVEQLADDVNLDQYYEFTEQKAGLMRETFVYIAAMRGHLNIVTFLADRGVDLNRGQEGWGENHTPIFAAARDGHVDIVKFFLGKKVRLEENLLTSAKTEEIQQLIFEELQKKMY